VGTITLAPMAAVFVGTGGDTAEHRHLAHKIVVGATAVEGNRGFRRVHGPIAIPAGAPHRVLASERKVVLAYLDARRFRWAEAARLAERWKRLASRAESIDSLLEDLESIPARGLDARALDAIEAMAHGETLADVSRRLALSESRVTHLVTGELGAPPRAWRRWLRLRNAIDFLAEGRTVTDAAHAAGFADSSHFSRTCSASLGVAPSVLRSSRIDRAQVVGECTPRWR